MFLKNVIGRFVLGEKIQATTAGDDGHFANTNLLGMLTTDPARTSISDIKTFLKFTHLIRLFTNGITFHINENN